MKKLLSIVALVLAFTPFAHAQGLVGHENARNDRRAEELQDRAVVAHRHHMAAKHMRHAKRHHVYH
ncbi:hypothetical protein [Glaciimonas sp. PCH181]|uniref:hypothetical protein n=1 Tax=Glaciimonas sp. PCH181 TaxID=2133943 RepID=UPI000D3BFC7E|nr:hypothetical protein [Glaciimonas sp. PCH181]PUA17366.1 hypothetical protein C7W93_15725 [Glaciimonas sp. PCH181]